MKTAKTLAAMAVVLAGFSSTTTADQAVDAPIKKVTVYSDRAMITRIAELDLAAGEHTLLFENLPEGVLDASFRASASGVRSLTILGLSHRDTVRIDNPQEKVAKLEHVINAVKAQKQQAILDRLEALSEQKKFLAAISKSAGDEMTQEVAKGGIDVAQWESAFHFIGRGIVQVNDSTRLFKAILDSIQRELDMLNRTLSDYRSPVSKTTKMVQVDVRLETAGHVQVNLEYVIPGATWIPLYDARLTSNNERVDLSYNAEISQHTGEDWKDVELTLSTASPSLGAGPGDFSPWYLASFTLPQSPNGMKGQIRGTITDSQTGEPIIGASVLLAGTKLGAQTDPGGNYVISGVTPGLYTMTVASVGYNTIRARDLDVNPQLTSELNIPMKKASGDLGVTIEVRAKQEIIDKFCTTSRTATTADLIRQPRVQTVDYLLSQSDRKARTPDGQLLIRGGSSGEAFYYAGGVPMGDPSGGLGGAGTSLQAVEGFMSRADIGLGHYTTVFKIMRKETIPSGDKTVRTTIAVWSLAGSTRIISRPRNIEGAYRIVTITNQNDAPLMPGLVAIFAESDFLGNAYLTNLVVPGQAFELPFGVDNSLKVERKVQACKRWQNSDKTKVDQTIAIKLFNHGKSSREIHLEEQLPVSRDGRVKVNIGDIQPLAPTIDESGKAQWTVRLQAGDSTTVSIPYRIEYPTGMQVVGL